MGLCHVLIQHKLAVASTRHRQRDCLSLAPTAKQRASAPGQAGPEPHACSHVILRAELAKSMAVTCHFLVS